MPPERTDLTSFSIYGVPVELQAAEGEESLPKAQIKAYTGGLLRVMGWPRPVVVDLAGLRAREGGVKFYLRHSEYSPLGHVESVDIGERSLSVEAVFSFESEQRDQAVASGKNGFPWEASIGLSGIKAEFVPENATVEVNGQTFRGPIYVARKSTLREVSLVPEGADARTSAKIVASATPFTKEDGQMEFTKWLEAKGFDPENMTEEQKGVLKAAYEAEKAGKDDGTLDAGAQGAADPNGDGAGDSHAADLVAKTRENVADEMARIEAVRKACGENTELAAQAVKEGWAVEKAELEAMKASRPAPFAVQIKGQNSTPQVLEAAIRLGGDERQADVEKAYDEQVLTAADRYRGMGLKELIAMCCVADGVDRPALGAGPQDYLKAAFSSASLTNILGNTANRVLLQSYRAVPKLARKVFKKVRAQDFKSHTGYRLNVKGGMPEVGQDGELKHVGLTETGYSYSVTTKGFVLTVTRQMIINDDLGAFTEIPQKSGRLAAQTLEADAWTLVLDNTGTFFGSDNGNYIDGAATALDSEAIAAAVKAFRHLQDHNDQPILIEPQFLVVPATLEQTAVELYVAANIVAGGSSSKNRQPSDNIYKGRYEPVVVPHLDTTGFHTSISTTGWYLFGDPDDVAAFALAYLRGREEPVFEAIDLPGDVLGRGWRLYFDYGVAQWDSNGAVKSKGSA